MRRKNIFRLPIAERKALAARIRLGETASKGGYHVIKWVRMAPENSRHDWWVLDEFYFKCEDFVACFGAKGVWDDILHWLEK